MKHLSTFLFLFLTAFALQAQHRAHIGLLAGAGGRTSDSPNGYNPYQYGYTVGLDLGWQVWRPIYLVGRGEYQYRTYSTTTTRFSGVTASTEIHKNTLMHQLGIGLRWASVYGSVAATYADNLNGTAKENNGIIKCWEPEIPGTPYPDLYMKESFSAWGWAANLGIARTLTPRSKALFEVQYQKELGSFKSYSVDNYSLPNFKVGIQFALGKKQVVGGETAPNK